MSVKRALIHSLVLICQISALRPASAAWLLSSAKPQIQVYGYLAPNEVHPSRAVQIFASAIKGIYIGLGADRCFNLPSLSPLINRIICVDVDPEIVRFNLMNIFWLRTSRNRADYEHLRLHASWRELEERLRQLKTVLNPNIVAAVTEQNLNSFRDAFSDWKFRALHDRDFPVSDNEPMFKEVNYVHKDEQYGRLKRMADADLIEAHLANLKQDEFQDDLIRAVDGQVSVIDASNAWGGNYIGREKIFRLLDALAVRNPRALFVYTDQMYDDSDPYDFTYGAVTLANRSLLIPHAYTSPVTFGLLDRFAGNKACVDAVHKK